METKTSTKMMNKKEIRKTVLEKRDSLTPCEKHRSNVLVTERILGHQWYYGAEQLLLFASFGSEIDTGTLMKEALRQGKKVYMPCILNDNMEFYEIKGEADLAPGYRGIREPVKHSGQERFLYSEKKAATALMIMPGVAFDPERNRIGYGKGFYDRYLQDKPALRTIAIGYDCQMVAEIQTEETDVKPMQVICL